MKAIVIGAGIAGIASAIRLRLKGYEVEVFESNTYTGGKLHAQQTKGFRFDMGPSLFTMPHLVDELFELAGENPKDHFSYRKMEYVCNYFWEDGKRFNVPASEEAFIQNAAKAFDESEKHLRRYLKRNQLKYNRTKRVFLENSLHKLETYLSADTLKSISSLPFLHLNNSLDRVNRRYFSNPKLIQLFNRYATYNGSTPYRTPGIMSLIPHLEMHYGAFLPVGGMHEISQSLTRLAERLGIKFQLGKKVDEILHSGSKVTGIQIGDAFHSADMVVSNMDVFATFNRLLPQAKKPMRTLRQERSSSALIFYLGVNRQFPELDLHNIFFSESYQEEFEHLFDKKTLHPDPTVYVNITSKYENNDAPKDGENWFVMINAPGNFGQDWDALKKEARHNILKKLQRNLGVDVEPHIQTEFVWDPVGIEEDTSSHRGSLYGTSSNSQFAAFLRHPNFSRQFDNLYFCGGSVHPGGGIPLCLLSARIVGDLIPSV